MQSPEAQLQQVSATFRAHGLIPSWERVWSEGVDITHQPPRTWPWPWSMYVSGQRGEALRRQHLAWHAQALAEREGW